MVDVREKKIFSALYKAVVGIAIFSDDLVSNDLVSNDPACNDLVSNDLRARS